MRDFVFSLKESPNVKATLRTDIIDDSFELFTIMWWEGVENTNFEKIIPWKLGTVLTEKVIKERIKEFQPILSCVKYGEDAVKILGVEEHELTITPTITNGDEAFVIVVCENEFGHVFKKTVPLIDGETSTVEIVEGFEYSFELSGEGDAWVTEPDAFVCNGDKSVSLGIAIPISLPVHTLTITPTITNGDEASVTLVGTKAGYSTVSYPINLENGVDKVVDIFEGFEYSFELVGEGDAWVTEPGAFICDDDKLVSLGIARPIDLPVHTLTITPTLTGATETSVTLVGTKAGYSTVSTSISLENSVNKVVDIYEGYSYEFTLDSNDTWTSGAPSAIICDGDETVALEITVVA